MESVLRYIHRNRDRYIAELKEFLTIPSISNNAENRADMERCAAFLKDQLESIGMQEAAVFPTEGHPVVYGEWLGRPANPPCSSMGTTTSSRSIPSNSGSRGPSSRPSGTVSSMPGEPSTTRARSG